MAKKKYRRPPPPPEAVEEPPASAKAQERRTWWIATVVVLVAIAAAIPLSAALLHPSTAGDASPAAAPLFEPPPPPKATPAKAAPAQPSSGKELFIDNCGGCHKLAAAGTEGAGGPNLDKLHPGRRRVLAAIQRGGSGYGVMPRDLVEGKDAERVARFVAASVKR